MKILLTDTHFGVKQNSITWLKSQLSFFYSQLIPFIKQQKERVLIYHLGDLFDSRSSINPYIADQVRKLFIDLSSLENVSNVIIIGGNHDYYSPNDSSTNSIDLILRNIDKVELITNGINMYEDEELDEFDVFVPWNDYFDLENLESWISIKGVKRIFIHNDLDQLKPEYRKLFNKYDINIYSGHIHIPKISGRYYNLGSLYALNFADANQKRGFYYMNDDGSNFTFVPNEVSIRFYRLYNDEIFKDVNYDINDYVELYIDQDNLSKERYQSRIKIFNDNVKNLNIIPISRGEIFESNYEGVNQYSIDDICKEMIPENLKDKFNIIIEEYKMGK